MEVIVDGLDELARDLARAAVQTPSRAGDAIEDVATRMLHTAEALAPVLTGNLRASGSVRRSGLMGAEVIFDAPYADYVEHGTSDTAPQPFLGPAADIHTPSVDEAVADALDRLL